MLKFWIKRNNELIRYYTKKKKGFKAFLEDAIRFQKHEDKADSGNLFRAFDINYKAL